MLIPVAALTVWPFLGFTDYKFIFSPSLNAISTVFDSGRWLVTLPHTSHCGPCHLN